MRALENSQKSMATKQMPDQEKHTHTHTLKTVGNCVMFLLTLVPSSPQHCAVLVWRREQPSSQFPLCNQGEQSRSYLNVLTCLGAAAIRAAPCVA